MANRRLSMRFIREVLRLAFGVGLSLREIERSLSISHVTASGYVARAKEAAILIEQWRRHYNGVRPHSALGYRPPAPETIAFPAFGFATSGSSLENQGVVLH